MKKIAFSFGFILIFLSFLFSSCLKIEVEDQETLNENIKIDYFILDAFFVSSVCTDVGKNFMNDINSFIISVDTLSSDEFITKVQFDNCDFLGDGIIRNGKIIIQWKKNWTESCKKTYITFDNYQRNGQKLNGTIEVKYLGNYHHGDVVYILKNEEENTQPVFCISDSKDMKLTMDDTATITFYGGMNIIWLNGFSNEVLDKNNIFQISYRRFGVNRFGQHFRVVTSKLKYDLNCQYFFPLNGWLQFEENDVDVRAMIEFGNGSCDKCYIYKQGKRKRNICED